jgi:hypothetical protein
MNKIWFRKAKEKFTILLFLLYGFIPLESVFNFRPTNRAAIELDFRVIAVFIAIIAMTVISASIFFVLTTPSGQQGLGGIGYSIANAVASPFIAFFNIITDFFNGIGSTISGLFGSIGKSIGL